MVQRVIHQQNCPQSRTTRWLRAVVTLLLVPVVSVGVAATTSAAWAAGSASPNVDRASGFPVWYQDSAGNRVEACLDANDPNCVLPTTGYDPAAPLRVPDNFPDEFFYAVATSDTVSTLGCNGTVPGKALVTLALEGAFLNGPPVAGEQMVFGRIRVKVTSGLCPNTTYKFQHPFGTDQFTTNAAGAVPANVGTQDVGCVPAVNLPCDFTKAAASRVMGSAADGFLRWDPAVAPAAPAGYLGDGVTPHPITGGTNGNSFAILDANGNPLVDAANGNAPLATGNFTVSGKLAGPLSASPSPADLGGQDLGTTSAVKTVTVTNLDKVAVTPQAATVAGGDAGDFAVTADTCANVPLNRDQSCTIGVTFTPTAPGRRTSSLVVPSTGGARSPLTVAVTGSGTNVGAAPQVTLTPAALDTGAARVRTESAPATLTIGNSGDAPLDVRSVRLVNSGISGAEQFRISTDACTTGQFVDPGASCTVSVVMAPTVRGVHNASLEIVTNASSSPDFVAVTGTATGGVAAVSPDIDASNGFPTWYRDENGIKVAQCIDPNDPNCIVLADEFYDPALPLSFPSNFPSEFFYQVATSDNIITPGCNGGPTGRALFRSALEGAFVNAGPVPGEQMVFGRIRIVVRGGLCPNTTYTFLHPYGKVSLTTNGNGGIAPNAGTDDVGCAPIAPDACDFSLALSSRVLGSLLRWDPAVAPAAPAGYLGDGATLHAVTGAPYTPDGRTDPANYFEIQDAAGATVGKTNQFSVMGKLQGPLEASPTSLALDVTPVGSTSATKTVTLTNTGIAPLDVSTLTVTGTDPGDFQIATTTCTAATLDVGATCTAEIAFAPTATGDRSATLVARHSGLNDPLQVQLTGTGAAPGATAAISFVPRAVTFAPLHVGRTSPIQTVNISNSGGQAPLDVNAVALSGAAQANFAIVDENCVGNPVAPGASCQVRVAFTPQAAGSLTASLVVTDNAPGNRHTLGLSGTGSTADPAVSPATDSRNGFPQWYQDSTGTRLEGCLDPADTNCVLLPDATFDPANPVSFPSNFPGEFFYALADSNLINTPGCGGTSPGTAMLRVALEGSFVNGTPVPDEQMTFARLRVNVTSGLCPNTPYRFTTPYGVVAFTTNAAGGLPRNQGTVNVGCGPVAPATCVFAEALGDPDPATGLTDTVAHSFLRWDPAVATAPAGYLGDGKSFKKVVGGTYIPAGASEPVNYAAIVDTAGNEIARTDTFLVSGKLAGPLQSDAYSLDFGRLPAGQSSQERTVTLTNVQAGTSVQSVSVTGVGAGEFSVNGSSTCIGAANLALDATCQVKVTFAPATTGTKTATLRIEPVTGSPVLVTLKGIADPPAAPAATVTPGTLAYGTVTAPNSSTLSTTVTNTGTADLVVGLPSLSGTGAADYSITANTCTTPVAPAATCTISVRFKPTVIGARTGSLTIPHNATGGQTVVSLTATGAGSTFVLSPDPVNFGTQNKGSVKTQTVTVKNSGQLAFTVGAATIGGTDAAAFTVSGTGCVGTVLQPGKTCNLTVTFRPTAARSYSATVVLAGDASSLPPSVSARLTGAAK